MPHHFVSDRNSRATDFDSLQSLQTLNNRINYYLYFPTASPIKWQTCLIQFRLSTRGLNLCLLEFPYRKKSTLYSRKEPSIRSKFSLSIHDQSVFKIWTILIKENAYGLHLYKHTIVLETQYKARTEGEEKLSPTLISFLSVNNTANTYKLF